MARNAIGKKSEGVVRLFEDVLELPRHRDEFRTILTFLGFCLGLRAQKSSVLRAIDFTETDDTVACVFQKR